MTEWYYTKMGLQQGPVPEDEIRQKIRRGEIGDSNLLWRDGMADWLPFTQIPELQNGPVSAAIDSRENPGPPPMVAESQLQTSIPLPQPPVFPGYSGESGIPTYLWQSVVALVVSCLAMMLFCLPLGLPFAIVALVYANKVEKLKAQGDLIGALASSGNAKIWMIVSFACSGLLIIGFFGLLIFAISS